MSLSMGTELDASLFQETVPNQDMIISSWLDDVDPNFSQELQYLEDHLFNFEPDPVSSLSIPAQSPFSLDTSTQPNGNYQCVVPVEQPEPDVCDTFLNDYEFFGFISPNDLSPAEGDYDYDYGATRVLNYCDQPMMVNEDGSDNDEDGSDNDEDTKQQQQRGGRLNSKNLVSERNRRKRLSHQLLSLRALVPNITKMDKRSVLVDALSYLTNIHKESEKLDKKQQQQQGTSNPSGALRVPTRPCSAPTAHYVSTPKPQITEIDAEKIEEKRFVVKITCKGCGSSGGGNDIVRVIESLDFEVTYTALQQLQPQQLLVTIFIRVRKQGKMTEEKLKRYITTTALKTGLTFQKS